MRKYIDLIESQLDEVIHEPQYPVSDNIASQHLKVDFDRATTHEVGRIDNLLIVSTSKLPSQIFVLDGDRPVGQMSLFAREHYGEKTLKVSYSYILPEYRGIGFRLYCFVLDQGYRLLSDHTHTDDSRRLWQKLARTRKVTHNGEVVTDTDPYYNDERSSFMAESGDRDNPPT